MASKQQISSDVIAAVSEIFAWIIFLDSKYLWRLLFWNMCNTSGEKSWLTSLNPNGFENSRDISSHSISIANPFKINFRNQGLSGRVWVGCVCEGGRGFMIKSNLLNLTIFSPLLSPYWRIATKMFYLFRTNALGNFNPVECETDV